MSLSQPLGKALLLAPVCFAVGLAAREWAAGRAAEDAEVERRVARARGTWQPPELLPGERLRLRGERDALRVDIAALEARRAARQSTSAM